MKVRCESRKTVELIAPYAAAENLHLAKYRKMYYKYCPKCNEIYQKYRSCCPKCLSGRINHEKL